MSDTFLQYKNVAKVLGYLSFCYFLIILIYCCYQKKEKKIRNITKLIITEAVKLCKYKKIIEHI